MEGRFNENERMPAALIAMVLAVSIASTGCAETGEDEKNAIIKCPLSTIISKNALNTRREGRVVVGHVLDVSPLPSS